MANKYLSILKHHLSKLDDNGIENVVNRIEHESWAASDDLQTEEERNKNYLEIKYALEAIKDL